MLLCVYMAGPPAWALSRTLPRAQQHVSSSSSSFTGSSFKDQQDFPQNVTIKLVSYPSDWFGTYHLLEEDGWLGYLLERCVSMIMHCMHATTT